MDANPATAAATHSVRYGRAAAGVLLLLAIAEFSARVIGPPWPSFPAWASKGVSVLLTVLWSAAAITVLLRRHGRVFALAAWVLCFASVFAMVGHALVTMAGHSLLGGLYLPAALLAGVLLKRTFDAGELARLRQEHRLAAPVGAA